MQKAFGKKSVIFMFLFPAFLIYTAFVIVSIVWAGYYSFFDWSGVGEKIFVGFKNYVELLTRYRVPLYSMAYNCLYDYQCGNSGIWRLTVCSPSFPNQKRQSCFTDFVLYSGSNFISCNLPDFYKTVLCNTNWNRESDFILHKPFIQVHGVDIKSADFTVRNSVCRGL